MPRVVVALTAPALSERGWPSLDDDPEAAAARAARSIAYIAVERSVIVTHCLDDEMVELLRRSLERELGMPVLTVVEPDTQVIERFADQRFVVLCATGSAEWCHPVAASDLAVRLDADMLLVLTDEPVLWHAADDGEARGIKTASPASLGTVEIDGTFDAAIDAARRFVEATSRVAAIGAIDHAETMVAGEGGTQIRDYGSAIRFYGA
jgi:carbamate kinase